MFLGDLPEIKFVQGNSSFVVRDAFHGVVGSPVLDVNVICFPKYLKGVMVVVFVGLLFLPDVTWP